MDQIKAVRFRYHGHLREVDNISEDNEILTGFEMRKDGKFSYGVKKYRKNEIEGEIVLVDPPIRSGPAIGRP
jgi:hypothetical protein